ncbi:MAG: insulinase family protein [Planctomycetes bacterium]|nr:insulinase family protein [Planctomycetota bacterium]
MNVRHRFLPVLAVLFAAFAVVLSARAAEKPLDLKAELPIDPNLKMGTLPNGMKYWIRKHDRPPGKIGFWLHIGSGSINEEDSQRGLAHFLEHMAFNGSANFPPGTLVKYFESIGLRFGQHQNAFTSFDQTTYQISLPDTKEETIAKGLVFMSDVGYRLALPTEEIERERAVVLEESRARKGAQQRITDKLFPILAPDSRFAERMPIGKEEIIAKAPPDLFKTYYAKWYRPDLATLMVVGDCDPAVVEKLLVGQFEGWKPVEKPAPDADPGIKAYTEMRAAVITDPELTETEVSAIRVGPLKKEVTVGDMRERMVDQLGCWIVNRRLGELVQKGQAPFQGGSVSVQPFLNVCTYVDGSVSGKPDQWQAMMTSLLTEIKRARDHGFLEQEFDDAIKETLEGARQAAKTEGTWDARAFLSRMNNAVSQGRKPMAEAQRLELVEALLPSITLKEVHESFVKSFDPQSRLLLVTMPEKLDLKIPKQEELVELAKKVEASEVKALTAKDRPKSLLDRDPEPGKVVEQEEEPDLKILTVTFENGVRVHLRQMDFKKDQVFSGITVAGGEIQETAENRGITDVASLALGKPATLKLDSTTVRDLMTGKQIAVGGGSAQDTFSLHVSGSPKDLEDGFRLAYLLLTQPRVEDPAVKKFKEEKVQELEMIKTSAEAQLSLKISALLSNGDIRFAELTPEELEKADTAKSQAWLDQALANGPIEASIVGDLDREKMLAIAAKYLGSLPKRGRTLPALDPLRTVAAKAGPHEALLEVPTITPRGVVFVGWRGADWKDVKDRRILEIAARILSSRVHEEIRQKRGLAYSPGAFARPSQGYSGMGVFGVYFQADPDKSAEAAKLTRELVETFAKDGPTDAEMETVRKQLKNALETTLKEPSYWNGVLADLDYRGTKLSDVKEVIERMTGYTKEEIVEVLKRYITEERRVQVLSLPKRKAPETKTDAKTDAPAEKSKEEQKTP